MEKQYLLTSESVTEGHPDKIADQISDLILDKILNEDINARVACETLVTTGMAFISGEITTKCYVSIPNEVRNLIKEIGYVDSSYGFDYETCAIITAIQEQSPDIAQGVDIGGAGDQGLVFGYAIDETKELMPMPIMLAHQLVRRLVEVRKKNILPYLRPDGKSQVTVKYKNDIPIEVDTVVIAAQHGPEIKVESLRKDIIREVIDKIIPDNLKSKNIKYYINPTGRFEIGGPLGDTGLTGRKIMVDTYGGIGRHGGGCFSGKDPTKVDRSASYMARYIAKNIVAAKLAKRCEIQISYAIGVKEPLSIMVNTFGTEKIKEEKLTKLVRDNFEFTPSGIIKYFDLRRPLYLKTACYGHFGREEEDFPWEKTDKVAILQKEAGI